MAVLLKYVHKLTWLNLTNNYFSKHLILPGKPVASLYIGVHLSHKYLEIKLIKVDSDESFIMTILYTFTVTKKNLKTILKLN